MIAHVDMDCFFVAIERFKDPSLVGKAVAVGGDPEKGRSVVTSASYEARQYGIHSAMPMAVAIRRCPHLVVVPVDFERYDRVHLEVKKVLESFSPAVDMTSIDEGYVDLTGTGRLWGPPLKAAERIKWAVQEATGLTCTVGLAKNRLVAKIASGWAKPDGLLHIPPQQVEKLLAPLPVEAIPGVGEKMAATLRSLGLERVGQIQAVDESLMDATFGAFGRSLWRAARGEDPSWGRDPASRIPSGRDRGAGHGTSRKSISKEITFPVDTTDRKYLVSVLHYLTEKVCRSLRQKSRAARTVNVKLRYEDFETRLASATFNEPENRDEAIFSSAWRLMEKAITRRVGIRLVGVSLSNLTGCVHQTDLFEETGWVKGWQRLQAVDLTRERFGFNAVLSGEAIYLLAYPPDRLFRHRGSV
ncbi:MAG: DNA polymerase IV [Fidelibacterota bacterium]